MNSWDPSISSYGCGWAECEICGPVIEVLKEKEHKRVGRHTDPEDPENMLYARARGRNARKMTKVKRILTPEQREAALGILAQKPILKVFRQMGKGVWLSEVWLELENPTNWVARAESKMSLKKRVDRAVNRAQANMIAHILSESGS